MNKIKKPFQKKTRETLKFKDQVSLTKQSSKDECDINCIMAKYIKTGVIDHVKTHKPIYGDHTGISYKEALDTLHESQQLFDDLPAATRKEFNNDPAEFLEFVENPENVDRMAQFGLTRAPESRSEPLSKESNTDPELTPQNSTDDSPAPA